MGEEKPKKTILPEMRKNPTSGRWSVVTKKEEDKEGNKLNSARYEAPGSDRYLDRHKTPLDDKNCPFSRSFSGGRRQDKDPVFGLRWQGDAAEFVWHESKAEREKLWHSDEWEVMIVEHDYAQVNRYIKPHVFGHGPFLSLAGYGIHDMIIEDPTEDHKPLGVMPWKRTMLIFLAMLYRLKGNLGLDSSIPCFPVFSPDMEKVVKPLSKTDGIRHVALFHNYLREAGASQEHPHCQIIASPIIPTDIAAELAYLLKRFSEPPGRCIYCQVIETEINKPKRERVLFENDSFLAIHPYAPAYPFEIWILPKKHSPSFEDIIPPDYTKEKSNPLEDLAKIVNDVVGRLYVSLLNPGYNLLLKTAPTRRFGEQQYEFHWHVRIEPRGLYKPAGFEVGTGIYSCETPPEEAVDFLQKWGVLPSEKDRPGSLKWYIDNINNLKKKLKRGKFISDEELQIAWNANHILEILPQKGMNTRNALELRGLLDEIMKNYIQLQRSQYQREYAKEDRQKLQILPREFEEMEGPHYRSDLTTERWVLIPSKKRRKKLDKLENEVSNWHKLEANEIEEKIEEYKKKLNEIDKELGRNDLHKDDYKKQKMKLYDIIPLKDAKEICPFCGKRRADEGQEDEKYKHKALFGIKLETNPGNLENKYSIIKKDEWMGSNEWDIFVIKNQRPMLEIPENESIGPGNLPILKGSGVFQQIEGKGVCDVIVIGNGSTESYINLNKEKGTYGDQKNPDLIEVHRSLGQMYKKYTESIFYAIMIRLGAPENFFKNKFLDPQSLNGLLSNSIYRQGNPIPGPVIKHVTIFSNHGRDAGARNAHPTWQIIGVPVIPTETMRELAYAKSYYDNNSGRCCYCDMIGAELEHARLWAENEKVPSRDRQKKDDTEKPDNRIIYPQPDKNGNILPSDFIVLAPYAARVPFELWILPYEHQSDMINMTIENKEERESSGNMTNKNQEKVESLASIIYKTLKALSDAVNDPPYSLIIKNAPIAPKEHPYMYSHYHWRIIIEPQRLAIDAGYEHLTGIWSNPTPPEEYAALLREKWPTN